MTTLALLIALAAPPEAPVVPPSEAPAAAPQWTLQVDPLTTALGFVHVQVERALAPHWSVYLGPSLHLFQGVLADGDVLGLGAEAGVRWFVRPTAPAGWWLEVRGVLAHLTTEAHGTEETGLGGYVSALGGYTWIHGCWLLAGGAGVQYLNYRVSDQGPKGVLPALHTTVGLAF